MIKGKKIHISELTCSTAAKHKWCLKERHGMIRTLLVSGNCSQDILVVIGALAFTIMIQQLIVVKDKCNPSLLMAAGAWRGFTECEQITVHEGWKVLSDEDMITTRLVTRNGTHLSVSGDSPFVRWYIADSIGLDSKGKGVDEILQGIFSTDEEGLNKVSASSEIQSFIKALQIPLSAITVE